MQPRRETSENLIGRYKSKLAKTDQSAIYVVHVKSVYSIRVVS